MDETEAVEVEQALENLMGLCPELRAKGPFSGSEADRYMLTHTQRTCADTTADPGAQTAQQSRGGTACR
eukprot:3934231-Rhodomonas_salina.4